MKSEHRSTGDEVDMRAKYWDEVKRRWDYLYCYIANGHGVRRKIKRQSHRIDRRRARARIRRGDYE